METEVNRRIDRFENTINQTVRQSLGDMQRFFEQSIVALTGKIESVQRELAGDIATLQGQQERSGQERQRIERSLTVTQSAVSSMHNMLYGSPDLPHNDSVLSMLHDLKAQNEKNHRETKQDIQALRDEFEPRIKKLERDNDRRNAIEAQAIKIANFATSRRGLIIIGAIVVGLLILFGYAEYAQQLLPFLTAETTP